MNPPLLFCRRGLLALLLLGPLSAAERVALVIGNNTYDKSKPAEERPNLRNAVQNAEAVRAMLVGKLGFAAEDVVYGKDLGKVATLQLLEKFRAKAATAKVAMIYYAGHGMESLDGTTNFIIPVDARTSEVAASDAQLRGDGVDVGAELQLLGRAAPGAAKVIMLDCCRDRPSGRNLGAVRGGGLTPVAEDAIPAGTLVMLAAAPGREASDGKKHGPFTEALLEALPVPERTMLDSFFALSDGVKELTRGRQMVWMKWDGSAEEFRKQVLIRGGGVRRRVALVIGNADYKDLSDLRGPVHEVQAVTKGLEAGNFVVRRVENANLRAMELELHDFKKTAAGADVAWVHFSGHGLGSGRNFRLIPVDAKVAQASDVPGQTLGIDRVLSTLAEAGAKVKVVTMDADQDEVFSGTISREVDLPDATILIFAGEPGKAISDGVGDGSPFTIALTKAMAKPGQPFDSVIKEVTLAVKEATEGEQVPWTKTNYRGSFSVVEKKE